MVKADAMEKVKYLTLSFGFTLFLALLSQIRIPLPFTPVPLSLQTLGLAFMAYFLPSRWAIFSVIFYLFLGTLGLPFFAGGKGGLLILSGPTGGYLLGFFFFIYLLSWAKEKGYLDRFWASFSFAFLGHILLYLFGTLWFVSGYLKFNFSQDLKNLLWLTALPFIPSDALKSLLFATFVSLEKSLEKRRKRS